MPDELYVIETLQEGTWAKFVLKPFKDKPSADEHLELMRKFFLNEGKTAEFFEQNARIRQLSPEEVRAVYFYNHKPELEKWLKSLPLERLEEIVQQIELAGDT